MERDYLNNAAQMQASPYGESPAPIGLLDRLTQIGDPMAETIKLLADIEMRLFGPRPPEVVKGDAPNHTHLAGALDLTYEGAHAILERVRRISQRI